MLAYQVAIIEQMCEGFNKVFTGTYPDNLMQAPYVGPDYPFTREKFPSVIVSFAPSKTENMGMGHYVTIADPDTGAPTSVGQWRFEGTASFKIIAMTSLDRASISDQLVGILALGKTDPRFQPFWIAVDNNDFINFALLTGTLTPGSEGTEATPWGDTDALLYTSTISCMAVGDFYGETVSTGLVRISQVNLLPYRSDQQPPQGSGNNPWV